jgi:hypothetical protein
MAAVMRPDVVDNSADGTASIYAETDAQGKYVLEDIPPGRYVIAAGRLDFQTFYPGTQEIKEAKVVSIASGSKLTDIDFVLNTTSVGRSPTGNSGVVNAVVPLHITLENGAKLPVSADGKFISIRLDSSRNPISLPIDSLFVAIPGPTTMDFQVAVEGLPDNYVVKSMAYGTTDITRGTFRLTPANFPLPAASASLNPSGPPRTLLSSFETEVERYLNALSLSQSQSSRSSASSSGAFTPASTLSITLAVASPATSTGVRVSGRLGIAGKRLVYLSGNPGVLYSDGTFEFRNVPPGIHVIATMNSPSTALAGMVVVGDRDIDNVELKETILLPPDIRTPKAPLAAGDRPAGTNVPLARISGVVLEESTGEPIREGEIVIKSGDLQRTIPIGMDGRFEPFSLLPGTYETRFQIFGHSSGGPELIVEQNNIELRLTSRRLF